MTEHRAKVVAVVLLWVCAQALIGLVSWLTDRSVAHVTSSVLLMYLIWHLVGEKEQAR